MIKIAFGNARFLGAALQTLIIKDKTTSCQYLFVQKIHPVPVFPAPGFFARAQNMGCFQGMIPVFPQYGAEYVENLSGWTAGSRLVVSFSYTKRKRKELAVPMRFSWQAAAYGSVLPFCDQKGSEKVPPFRCGGRRLGLRPQTPRCGHLTTAYSPAWGPVNKEWI